MIMKRMMSQDGRVNEASDKGKVWRTELAVSQLVTYATVYPHLLVIYGRIFGCVRRRKKEKTR